METIIWKKLFGKVEYVFEQFLKNDKILNICDVRNFSTLGIA